MNVDAPAECGAAPPPPSPPSPASSSTPSSSSSFGARRPSKRQRVIETSDDESDGPAIGSMSRGLRPLETDESESENGSPVLGSASRNRRRLETEASQSESDEGRDSPIVGSVSRSCRPLETDESVSESEDESNSPIIGSVSRTCRPLETDESADESADDWTVNNENETQPKMKSPNARGWQSDSSEGDSEKCPICLLKFSSQHIGTPDTCEHVFCLDCLLEWSNHVNTCPVDRKEFSNIFAKKKMGGKVTKTIPVKPRRMSFDELVEEQPTVCQICRSAHSEETMLLCDLCDLGYHMECLNPPLAEIPAGDWYCPNCSSLINFYRHTYNLSSENQNTSNSISRANNGNQNMPSTSSQNNSSNDNFTTAVSRNILNSSKRRTVTRRQKGKRRKYRRKTRSVVIEYEIRDGEKFPSKTKRVVKRKRKVKRRVPRTVARRSLVRSVVRGRLTEMLKGSANTNINDVGTHRDSLLNIGVPRLKIFGDANELDIVVSGDDEFEDRHIGEGLSVVAAPRFHASALLQAHKQSRRKLLSMPSPSYASSAPDILSSIMENQTLLHSKNSLFTVNNDGTVIMELKNSSENKTNNKDKPANEKIDITKPESHTSTKQTPGYGNSGRGGNWRNTRNDYQNGNQNRSGRSYNSSSYQSSNYWENNSYSAENFSNSQDNSYFGARSTWTNNSRLPQNRDQYPNFQDRISQQRNTLNRNRGANSRFSPQVTQRFRTVPSWQPQNYSNPNQSYTEQRNTTDFSTEIEMSTSRSGNFSESNSSLNTSVNEINQETEPLGIYQVSDLSCLSSGDTLPQPPIIRFQKPSLSDDEKNEPKSVTDPDKYDPTEPTVDDSSTDEEDDSSRPTNIQKKIIIVSPPHRSIEEEPEPIITSFSPDPLNLSPKVIDHAVQLALKEHEDLLAVCKISEKSYNENNVEDECPNFSIYSSTSMDIAKNKVTVDNEIKQQIDLASEDLVQEDDVESFDETNSGNVDNLNIIDNQDIEDMNQTVIQNDEISQQNKLHVDNDDSNIKTTVSARTLIPKRNVIKINLSSSLGLKKRILGNDAENDNGSSSLKSNNCDNTSVGSNQEKNLQSESDKFVDIRDDNERSYTPCLDENKFDKTKNASIDIENLDTEMISEDEGNEIFSDSQKFSSNGTLELTIREKPSLPPGEREEGEIIEKNKQKIKAIVKELLENPEEKFSDDERKKRRKEKKIDKDGKGKTEKNKTDKNFEDETLSFKKLSKNGKGRNYRERDDKSNINKERRSKSTDKENKERRIKERKKERRKDMERYDVRNVILDKNRRTKDAFGRDKSRPKSNSPDSRLFSPKRHRRSLSREVLSHGCRTVSRERSVSKTRSKSPLKRSLRSTSRRRKASPRTLRSLSRECRSNSPPITRSISPKRRRVSPKRRSMSTRHRSISQKHSISPHRNSLPRQRSISRHRSISRRRQSISPQHRSVSPEIRKSLSRKRSITPKINLSLPHLRRSFSPKRKHSKSPRRKRSRSRNKRIRRSISRSKRNSAKYRAKSPKKRTHQSRLKASPISRNRSRSPRQKKSRKLKRNRSNSKYRSKSPIKSKSKRKKSPSYSPILALSRSLSRDRIHHRWHEVAKSPLYQDWTSGSQSINPPDLASPGWTPPPMEKSPEPRNLRVILTTKESKTKKKEKKKKSNKRNKTTDRILKHQARDVGPSKEVFTSGNNILVSVSFNKSKDVESGPITPPNEMIIKKRKRKMDVLPKSKKEKNKEKVKKKRLEKEKKSKDIDNKKPVAIIDLDKSPFKEITPSPKAVIVLSDSDTGEKDVDVMEVSENKRVECDNNFKPPEVESLPDSPDRPNDFTLATGPKTPPEPPIKFTIMSKTNPQLRAINPLHEDEDEIVENPEPKPVEEPQERICETSHKGPNTPPDPPNSPPSSPDAYDPFEPTKSGSASPEEPNNTSPLQVEIEKPLETKNEEIPFIPCISLEAAQKSNLSADDVIQAKPISPTEKVMALLKSTTRANLSPGNSIQQIFPEQVYEMPKLAESEVFPAANANIASVSPEKCVLPVNTFPIIKVSSPKTIYPTVTPTVAVSTPVYQSIPRIGVFNTTSPIQKNNVVLSQKINLPSPTKLSPLKTQPSKLFMTKPSPIKSTPIKPILSKTLISKLPLPTIKPLPTRVQKPSKTVNKSGQNGNDITNIDLDMDSPYSPGSSDFGDLFEPPSDNIKHTTSQAPPTYLQKTPTKFDAFDSLFGIKPSKNLKPSTTKVSVKQIKKPKGKTMVGVKMDEDSLKILDDLPSSAVEMQVKTKFLKKLNRQERVVEEVKLVLKPHYTKKHITKEDYKEIMRRAVPKICHNRSGEINPAKIHALIEAYVKKFRKKAHFAAK